MLLASLLLLTIMSIGYTWLFMSLLESGSDVGFGYSQLLVPDTFYYKRFYDDPVGVALISGAKNFIGPALLWVLLDGGWYLAAFANIAMILWTTVLLSRIGHHLRISISKKAILSLVLLPETFIYSIGVTKEIPTLFFFTALAYCFLRKNWLSFFITLALLTLFRYQFSFVVILCLLGNFAFGNRNVRFLLFAFLMLTAIYPLLIVYVEDLGAIAAESFKEGEAGLGVGAIIASIQSEWYGLSSIATLIRLLQMILEPWPAPKFIVDGNIGILTLIWSLSSVMFLPIWYRYFRTIYCAFCHPRLITRDESVPLSMSLAFIMIVAMNAYIHHRYLYPGFGLIILTAYLPLSARISVQKKKLVSAARVPVPI